MLCVKINIQAVPQQLFCTTKCICVKYFQVIAKSSKKEYAIYMK